MHGRSNPPPARRDASTTGRDRDRLIVMLLVVGVAIAGAAIIVTGGDPAPATQAMTAGSTIAPAPDPQQDAAADATLEATVEAEPAVDLEGCVLAVPTVREGSDDTESVTCVQKALAAAGYYQGEFTGEFDAATADAAKALQTARGLYVDGIVGARTAESLGIWPGAASFVVRTPVPPAGAEDLWGNTLSPVASTGDDAPPMPDDSGQGTGKRVVYDRAGQRVWAVDDEERVVRSYLVSGSQYMNELPGLHHVYSKSETTTAWNGAADLPLMVRWLDTERGAIGFHAIPKHRDTGEPYQTVDELGEKLSGGCQRQTMLDAQFMWAFADIGTPVYVT